MALSESNIETMRGTLRKTISAGDKVQGVRLAQEALDAGISPLTFFRKLSSRYSTKLAISLQGWRSFCQS